MIDCVAMSKVSKAETGMTACLREPDVLHLHGVVRGPIAHQQGFWQMLKEEAAMPSAQSKPHDRKLTAAQEARCGEQAAGPFRTLGHAGLQGWRSI
jgi:hypothetical protein